MVATCLAVPAGSNPAAAAGEPYAGSVYIDPNLITSADPTSFDGLDDAGRGLRTVWDRRENTWVTIDAYLFTISFDDGLSTVAVVNPEFATVDEARIQAEKYGRYVGQLPTTLRLDVDELWIHRGQELFGGGNNSLLIHTDQGAQDESTGFIEEVLLHESVHTSLDAQLNNSAPWQQAQADDPGFISTYAFDNPTREDLAESFGPYLMVRHFADRISLQDVATIQATIPNRIAFFDDQTLDLYPLVSNPPQHGDPNCDGDISIADAVMVAQYIVGSRVSTNSCPLDNPADQIIGAATDVNCSASATIIDAVMIAQYIVGVRTPTDTCPLTDSTSQIHLGPVGG